MLLKELVYMIVVVGEVVLQMTLLMMLLVNLEIVNHIKLLIIVYLTKKKELKKKSLKMVQ
jgi:hypothetical protein